MNDSKLVLHLSHNQIRAMSALLSVEPIFGTEENEMWLSTPRIMHECVFKTCCEKYKKKKGKHCKKCPKK